MGGALSLSKIGMMSRFILLLLGASRAALGKEWVSKAGEALAAAKPRGAPEATPARPHWLNNKVRRLDQTVDYDAACLTAFGQCEADLKSDGCAPCILSLVTEENDDEIDLPDDAEDWGCEQIVTFLKTRDFCPHIDPASHSATLLCSVWASCAQAVTRTARPRPL